MSFAVLLNKISKTYRSPVGLTSDSLRELLFQCIRQTHRSVRRPGSFNQYFALNEVDLRVAKGSSFAVIGRNGAGKSTLLRVIAGILAPDEGEVHTFGQCQFLSFGLGFHPDLTGNENFRVYTALMGLSKADAQAIYDDVVEFSELGEFMSMPVRTYSTGMVARLGFSCAIALQPEILLIDEALAVGDTNFVRKCRKKVDELRASDMTIVHASHDLALVAAQCDRAVWLENGKVMAHGDASSVVASYVQFLSSTEEC
jgi:lipopolysaccharide transport system ATP-binding protein